MVKVWYEYKWHTKKTFRSESGHKRSLYIRIVIKLCDTCFMAQFRRRIPKSRQKYHLSQLYREKIEIKFKARSKRYNFECCNFWKKLDVSDAECAQESNGAISFSVGQIELPAILFLYMTPQFGVMLLN